MGLGMFAAGAAAVAVAAAGVAAAGVAAAGAASAGVAGAGVAAAGAVAAGAAVAAAAVVSVDFVVLEEVCSVLQPASRPKASTAAKQPVKRGIRHFVFCININWFLWYEALVPARKMLTRTTQRKPKIQQFLVTNPTRRAPIHNNPWTKTDTGANVAIKVKGPGIVHVYD